MNSGRRGTARVLGDPRRPALRVEAEQGHAVEADQGSEQMRAALDDFGDALASVEGVSKLANHADRIPGLRMRGGKRLQDDHAVIEMHGDIERLGNACEEQGEGPRRALRIARTAQTLV